MSSQDDIRAFRLKTMKRLDKIRKGVIFKLFSAIIKDTPVGNPRDWRMTEAEKRAIIKAGYVGGRLRANWMLSVGGPDRSTTTSTEENLGTLNSRLLAGINASRPEEEVWLSNSLPYAKRVEYDGHSHTKAPKGMVRRNVSRFRRLLGSALKEIP